MTVFGGLAFVVSDGRTIFGRDIPASFSGFARSRGSSWAIGASRR
jgi:ribose transport system permease protein